MPRQALGKGLNALIPSNNQEEIDATGTGKMVVDVSIDRIKRNPLQPRLHVDEEKLADLAESIKENGIIQPIIGRKVGEAYELIAGERRTLAAKKAGFDLVPAIVYNVSDQESLEFALVENVQRDDLNALELGQAYKMLMDEFSLTQDQVAEKVGKDRASVANYIRILGLPGKIKKMVLDGELSFGHARALLSIDDEVQKLMLATLVVKESLSVRQCENLTQSRSLRTRKRKSRKAAVQPGVDAPDYHIKSLEEQLQQVLGTKVKITPKKKGGSIEIEYYSLDELDRILELFDIERFEE